MGWISWVFDGIGTSVVSLLLSFFFGGVGGWHLHKQTHKTKTRVIQRARNHATQTAIVNSTSQERPVVGASHPDENIKALSNTEDSDD